MPGCAATKVTKYIFEVWRSKFKFNFTHVILLCEIGVELLEFLINYENLTKGFFLKMGLILCEFILNENGLLISLLTNQQFYRLKNKIKYFSVLSLSVHRRYK